MDTKRVGRRIKAFRKLKGYTQVDFAKELGVSIALIGDIERGKREVTEELLVQIETVLNISQDEITLDAVKR